jgi:hypothetical protein
MYVAPKIIASLDANVVLSEAIGDCARSDCTTINQP